MKWSEFARCSPTAIVFAFGLFLRIAVAVVASVVDDGDDGDDDACGGVT